MFMLRHLAIVHFLLQSNGKERKIPHRSLVVTSLYIKIFVKQNLHIFPTFLLNIISERYRHWWQCHSCLTTSRVRHIVVIYCRNL